MNTQSSSTPGGVVAVPGIRPGSSLADETRAILRTYRARPKEQLGQHFLIDREALLSIVQAAALQPGTQVVEIGPGIGTLTLALAATGAAVCAVELDSWMARITRDRTAGLHNVVVREGNILHADLTEIIDVRQPYAVVANIPYYITAPILRLFLEARFRPTQLLLMVQREVGQRLAAGPGKMSALSVFAQINARVQVVRMVPATSFLPPPEVDSAVVRLELRPEPLVPLAEQPFLFRVARAGFGSKRKMIHNALDHGLPNAGVVIDAALAGAGVDRNRRAETLSIEEWRTLTMLLRQDTQHVPRAMRNDQYTVAGPDQDTDTDQDGAEGRSSF